MFEGAQASTLSFVYLTACKIISINVRVFPVPGGP